MIFAAPLPFAEAIASRAVKQLLPTVFRTKELATIPAQLRERAMFSAGVTNAEHLQDFSDKIDALLNGQTDRATARAELKKAIGPLGGGEVVATDLTDIRSDARLNLILDTNLQQAQGYGGWMQGQDPAVLDQWPAQELVRVIDSKKPRDWAARWAEAGGVFYAGRMIALKNDPIWTRISRFGTPYPPFDFNSGMDVDDIDRDEAIDLGLIDRDTELFPQSRDFNTDLQASPEVRAASLQAALIESLEGLGQWVGGVLKFTGGNN
jgi:hypothetical protein